MNRRKFFNRRTRPIPLWRVFGDAMLATIILGLLGAAALSFSGSEIRSLPDQLRVVDGDSLEVGNDKIRLWGIDAPEFGQQCRNSKGAYSCGREAKNQLRTIVKGSVLTCKGLGKDRYNRLLAVCRIGKTDVNAALVRGGFAYAYGGYFAEEAIARKAKAGIWNADNERPKAYRERTKAAIDLAPGVLDAIYQFIIRLTDQRENNETL